MDTRPLNPSFAASMLTLVLLVALVAGCVLLGMEFSYRRMVETQRQQAASEAIVREHLRRLEADAEYRERVEQFGE